MNKDRSKGRPAPKAYTVSDVANMISVSPRSLWRQIALKRIKIIRIGRSVGVPAEALDTLLNEGCSDE